MFLEVVYICIVPYNNPWSWSFQWKYQDKWLRKGIILILVVLVTIEWHLFCTHCVFLLDYLIVDIYTRLRSLVVICATVYFIQISDHYCALLSVYRQQYFSVFYQTLQLLPIMSLAICHSLLNLVGKLCSFFRLSVSTHFFLLHERQPLTVGFRWGRF